jgi:hypothetical protein
MAPLRNLHGDFNPQVHLQSVEGKYLGSVSIGSFKYSPLLSPKSRAGLDEREEIEVRVYFDEKTATTYT